MKIFNKYIVIAMHVGHNYAKGLRCIAIEYLSNTYKAILVFQPNLSLKTLFRAHFNNHVTSHITHKIDE